jgi:hypothetical protein
MNLFQLVSIPIAALLAIASLFRLVRGGQPRWVYLASALVWLAAGMAIAAPDSTTTIAHALGIGRGADLLTYVLAIAFVLVTFYFYHRHRQLTVQLTELTRHIALREARPPDEAPPGRDT